MKKTPIQQRSARTASIIVEAAARVLEERGFQGFNTNAIAECAGISIGSFYQYFPNKQAVFMAVKERESQALLALEDKLIKADKFRTALRVYIRASIRHLMRRPKLTRLIHLADGRELFDDQVSMTSAHLATAIERVLELPGAPRTMKRSDAAKEVLAIVCALVDAAGQRGETESKKILRRAEGAVMGYLGCSR